LLEWCSMPQCWCWWPSSPIWTPFQHQTNANYTI
jgi:hypothetical protein